MRPSLYDPFSGIELGNSHMAWDPTLVSRFMPVSDRMSHEAIPTILREIADGLTRSFVTETDPDSRSLAGAEPLNDKELDDLLSDKASGGGLSQDLD